MAHNTAQSHEREADCFMALDPIWWEQGLDRVAYRVNRAQLLTKLLLDYLLWAQALAPFAQDASLAATWVDHAGQVQVTAINQAFLAAQLRILRSVMHDLAKCGPEGQRLIQTIVANHLSLLGDREDGHA